MSATEAAPLDVRSSYAGRRVLVLGAAGFIGAWVVRALAAAGAELHVTLRAGTDEAAPVPLPPERVRTLDLERPGPLEELLDQCRPAVVFNLAGYGVGAEETDETRAARVNHELVERLLGGLVPHPSRTGPALVHVGSAAEYGDAGGDLREDGPATPHNVYGRTKLAGTQAVVRAAAVAPGRAVAARLFSVYGAGERPGRLLPTLLEATRTDTPIELSAGTQQRDFTFVADVAEGLLRLGARPRLTHPVLNLATGVLTSVRRFVEQAAGTLGIETTRLRFGARPPGRFDLEHDPVNIEALEGSLGWRPRTGIVDGVRRTVAALERAEGNHRR